MTLALTGTVELLERSLAWTRSALAEVTADRLGDPTPCDRWDLAALLHHMDDGLDAFTEAATGHVSLVASDPAPHLEDRLESIRAKACALLGHWCEHPPDELTVGDLRLPADLLVGTAALEIAVHGWDVHRALGTATALPEELAEALLPLAGVTVRDADRPARFAPARLVPADAPAAQRLLAHLGRG